MHVKQILKMALAKGPSSMALIISLMPQRAWACGYGAGQGPGQISAALDPWVASAFGAVLMLLFGAGALGAFVAAAMRRSKRLVLLAVGLLLCALAIFGWRSYVSVFFC